MAEWVCGLLPLLKGCCIDRGVHVVRSVGVSQGGSFGQARLPKEGWAASRRSELTITGHNQWAVREGSD